jgi:hypothetical protein
VPSFAALLARDSNLPKQFYRRSDSGVAAHGILAVGAGSAALIIVF